MSESATQGGHKNKLIVKSKDFETILTIERYRQSE